MARQEKASSQTAVASTTAKGKKVMTGARVLLIFIPQIPMSFSSMAMRSFCSRQLPPIGQPTSMSLGYILKDNSFKC